MHVTDQNKMKEITRILRNKIKTNKSKNQTEKRFIHMTITETITIK